MSSRIRYRPDEDFANILVSVQSFNTKPMGEEHEVLSALNVKVQLHLSTNSYEIVDSGTNYVVAEGQTTSLHSLKIAAKRALEELGVSFNKEQRKVSMEELDVIEQ